MFNENHTICFYKPHMQYHLVIMRVHTYSVQLSGSGHGRKLPSPPVDSETKEQVAKVSLNLV